MAPLVGIGAVWEAAKYASLSSGWMVLSQGIAFWHRIVGYFNSEHGMANRLPRKATSSASKLGAKSMSASASKTLSVWVKLGVAIVMAILGAAGASYYGFTVALQDSGYESRAQAAKINSAAGCTSFAAEGAETGLGLALSDPMLELTRLTRPNGPELAGSLSAVGWRLSELSTKCLGEAAKAKPGESELVVESALALSALSQRLGAASGDEPLLKHNMKAFSEVAKVSKALYAPVDSFKAYARRAAARRLVECSALASADGSGTPNAELEQPTDASACPSVASWIWNTANWPISGPSEEELARARLEFGGKRIALLSRLWIVAEPWSSLGNDPAKKSSAFEGEFSRTAQWSTHLDFGAFKSWLKSNGLDAALASHDSALNFGKVRMVWDEKKAGQWAPVIGREWRKADYEARLKKTMDSMSASGAVNPQDSLAIRTAAAVELMDRARDASLKDSEAKLDAARSEEVWPNWRAVIDAAKCLTAGERGLLNVCNEPVLVFAKPSEPCFGRMGCESLVSRVLPGEVLEGGRSESMACPAKLAGGASVYVDLRSTMRTGRPVCVSRVIEGLGDDGSCYARGSDRPCWYASGDVGVSMLPMPDPQAASR